MPQRPDPRYDVASAMAKGRRDYQEDALATDFPLGAGFGFAILSDGMGGHAAGDIASKIVVTEVFSELKFQSGDVEGLKSNVASILRDAAEAANVCVRAHADANPNAKGMGATLVAPVFIGRKMHWISVGDSPLLLYRGGRLRQLNEDHSLAPQIDLMVESGLMPPEIGQNHPDRNALTSVLIGDEIERIDCPEEAFDLRDGDILIAASDGLQFLSNDRIAAILAEVAQDPAEEIAEALLAGIEEIADPNQDNVSLTVIKYREKPAKRDRAAQVVPTHVVPTKPKRASDAGGPFARWRTGDANLLFQRRRTATGDGSA